MRKGIALLPLVSVYLGATASFAQYGQPGTNAPNTMLAWVLGEGDTPCTEVSRVVEEEHASRLRNAPKNTAIIPKYVTMGSFADGVWTTLNNMAGPITGENSVNHFVGENTDFDERMRMFGSYCAKHPDDVLYGAARAVRRDIVNRKQR